MQDIVLTAPQGQVLPPEKVRQAVQDSLGEMPRNIQRALLIVPDYTRAHSYAGVLAGLYYQALSASAQVDVLVALGTHLPMSPQQCDWMYGDIPRERLIMHNWRQDVQVLGEISAQKVAELSQGSFEKSITVEINRHIMDGYDLILSIGQVVPHEVAGMANHAKNIFVGCGGADLIHSSHMMGAAYGMEKVMGKDFSPVRNLFDYAAQAFLSHLPIYYALTVTTAQDNQAQLHGLYIGKARTGFEQAIAQAQVENLFLLDAPVDTMVVYLDPEEFTSTWLGNKAIYRTRMALADGGRLIILAPGVDRFGEDEIIDTLIRRYGYCGTPKIMQLCQTQEDLQKNLSAAAHLIHGSSEGRFSITYCTRRLDRQQVEQVCYQYLPYEQAAAQYNPQKLSPGCNEVQGEKIYFIPNPALGLWACKEKFEI